MISYAQNFEDLMLARATGGRGFTLRRGLTRPRPLET